MPRLLELESELAKLPASIRLMLETQCDGDWARVTCDGPGSFTVHNRPQRQKVVRPAVQQPPESPAKRVRKRTAPRMAKKVASTPELRFEGDPQEVDLFVKELAAEMPVAASPRLCGRCDSPDHSVSDCKFTSKAAAKKASKSPAKKRAERTVKLESLANALDVPTPRHEPISPGIVVRTDPQNRLGQTPGTLGRIEGQASTEEDAIKRSVTEMQERYKDGMALGFTYFKDVEDLQGIDFDIATSAVRSPQRVEIRPESFTKKYPVLGFAKGDMQVIMGYRDPANPMCIAIYVQSSLDPDVHRVSRMGGGGARKGSGTPTTPSAVVKALRQLGAEIDVQSVETQDLTTVVYHGQDLGKITTKATTDRKTSESDWQRMQRKIHSISQREKVTGGR